MWARGLGGSEVSVRSRLLRPVARPKLNCEVDVRVRSNGREPGSWVQDGYILKAVAMVDEGQGSRNSGGRVALMMRGAPRDISAAALTPSSRLTRLMLWIPDDGDKALGRWRLESLSQ